MLAFSLWQGKTGLDNTLTGSRIAWSGTPSPTIGGQVLQVRTLAQPCRAGLRTGAAGAGGGRDGGGELGGEWLGAGEPGGTGVVWGG